MARRTQGKFMAEGPMDKNYELKETIGKGTTSIVKKGIRRSTGEVFAVKVVDLAKLSAEQVKRCNNEVDILKQCDHPNVITLHDFFREGNKLYLVLDLMAGGDLFDRIVDREKFREADAITVIRKVVSALEYLHSRGIVHRDLKPENLLYFGPQDDSEIKMADFGLSKINFNPAINNSPCGTPGWCAPEILREKHYGKAVDMWSVGVILYTMLCGYPPFDLTISTPKLHEKVKKGEFDFPIEEWGKISREAKDLVQKLMTDDARKRYTAKEGLSHPWLAASFSGGGNILDSPKRLRTNKAAKSTVDVANSIQRMTLDTQEPLRMGPRPTAAGSTSGARPLPQAKPTAAKPTGPAPSSIFSQRR